MIVYAMYNIKGGVGKTAAAVNLAYLSALDGYRTLIIDLDPQAACSFYLRTEGGNQPGKKTLLRGSKKIMRNIKGSDYRNLDILPADFSLRNLDLVISQMKKPRKRLAKGLKYLRKSYDVMVIDCPPNITLVSENVFNAADYILVPVIPTTLSVRTYQQLYEFLVDQDGNSDKIKPFFSMVEKRKKMHRDIIQTYSSNKTVFMNAVIPYSSLVEKMGIYRAPVELYASTSPAAKAYRRLWKEIKKLSKLVNPGRI